MTTMSPAHKQRVIYWLTLTALVGGTAAMMSGVMRMPAERAQGAR